MAFLLPLLCGACNPLSLILGGGCCNILSCCCPRGPPAGGWQPMMPMQAPMPPMMYPPQQQHHQQYVPVAQTPVKAHAGRGEHGRAPVRGSNNTSIL
ncbi:ORF13 [Silurid herpesvirus 1]|nr:ORF13 [Silurid herpesvirus 1]AVP72263.1 ORF13 [Silurid herpesvirus 1]